MGLSQTFMEKSSTPLNFSETTAAQVSCINVLVLEASCPPASVVLLSRHQVLLPCTAFLTPRSPFLSQGW